MQLLRLRQKHQWLTLQFKPLLKRRKLRQRQLRNKLKAYLCAIKKPEACSGFFIVLIWRPLDLYLTAQLHHAVGWNLIEITDWTGIALHGNEQLFTPRRHAFPQSMNNAVARNKEADLH